MGLASNPGYSKWHTLVPHCGCGNSSALNVGQSSSSRSTVPVPEFLTAGSHPMALSLVPRRLHTP